MSQHRTALIEEKARLDAEIADLEASKRLLTAAIGELAHDGRRLTDALERMGGQAGQVERRRRALSENRMMSQLELKDIQARLAELKRRVDEIAAELDGLTGVSR